MDRGMNDTPEMQVGPANLEEASLRDMMIMVVREQRVTHQLVEALVRLLVPQELQSEGPTLEQLVVALLGQLRNVTVSVGEVHQTLERHEEVIPANTVKALRDAMIPAGMH